MWKHGVGGVGVDLATKQQVRPWVGGVGLGVGEGVLVVLGIVAGHITAQLQARFHERIHGGHARGVLSLLLPAHLLLPALAGQTTPHILPLQSAPNQTTLKD